MLDSIRESFREVNFKPEKFYAWAGDSRGEGSDIWQAQRKDLENLCSGHSCGDTPPSHIPFCPSKLLFVGKDNQRVHELGRFSWSVCHLAEQEPLILWSRPRCKPFKFPRWLEWIFRNPCGPQWSSHPPEASSRGWKSFVIGCWIVKVPLNTSCLGSVL